MFRLRHTVYYNDIPVGTICARLEKGKTDQEAKLYIMTMGVLAVSNPSPFFFIPTPPAQKARFFYSPIARLVWVRKPCRLLLRQLSAHNQLLPPRPPPPLLRPPRPPNRSLSLLFISTYKPPTPRPADSMSVMDSRRLGRSMVITRK